VFRRSLIATLLVLLLVTVPVAAADEPLQKGFEGSFELKGTHGYKISGLIGSTGTEGTLSLFVERPDASVVYLVRGEVTKEHVHFDLGALGEIDAAVQPTGRSETVRPACGKPLTVEREAYVGTIAFHGEEGFAEAEATRAPLRLGPLLDLVCGGSVGRGTVSGRGLPGVELKVGSKGGPRLRLDQNHPGARVTYEARVNEGEGGVKVVRTIVGHLAGRALNYSPSLDSAAFAPSSPFSGRATYTGKTPPHESRSGGGTWSGDLKADFPGHAAVRLAGPPFSASINHAKTSNFHS
jgi:hypothetical protein